MRTELRPKSNCRSLLVACLILGSALAWGNPTVHQKPKVKKPTPGGSTNVVMGTHQLAGEFGKFGTTYTIGKDSPLNFTLTGAEYRADRFVGTEPTGMTYSWVPDKTQKLLVIHYLVQNPLPREQNFTYQSWDFSAVSADEQNSKILNKPWIGSNAKYQDVSLKPGQKVAVTAAFFVPANGETPKLIVQRGYDASAAVVRYDLRGKVAKLVAPWSEDGTTTKEQVEMVPGGKYPLGGFDFTVASLEKASTPANVEGPDASKDQWVLKFAMSGVAPEPARLWYGSLSVRVKTDDGDIVEISNYQRLLHASRDDVFDGQIPVGETINVRMILELPKGVTPKVLTILPIENEIQRRAFIYKVGG